MERGGPGLGFGEAQSLSFVFVSVVGVKVEVGDDLHRPVIENVALEECVPDALDGIEIELVGEMATDGVGVRGVIGGFADVVD
jgi:hypothetical protein